MRSAGSTAALGLAVLIMGCGASAGGSAEPASPEPSSSPSESVLERAARADSVREHYTQADVDFMTDMIHHHAQALVMARMAPTHGASDQIQTLAARIINSQKGEIARMQQWLRSRGETLPEVPALEAGDTDPAADAGQDADGDHEEHHAGGDHAAMHDSPEHAAMRAAHHPDMMAGMLSPEQLARLDAARGEEWDRLFLTYMIQHHKGALVMVEELFDSYGAAQGDEIFQLASDIGADQATEIARMQRMLQELIFGAPSGS